MTTSAQQRPMTAAERATLAALVAQLPGAAGRTARAIGEAGILAAILMLPYCVAWGVVAWVARVTLDVEIGLRSVQAAPIAAVGAVACAAFAATSTWRSARTRGDLRALLDADRAGGTVEDVTLELTAAKRFQEPEHGGLVYFLRVDDGRVYVVYDSESQDLAIDGGDPLQSPLVPREALRIVRAPRSGHVLEQAFAGTPLALAEPDDLVVPPDAWPDADAFCAVPWDALDARYGSGAAAGNA